MHRVWFSIEVIDIDESTMFLLGEKSSMTIRLSKDEESTGSDDGVWE
jgi:hypothetical protein